MYEWWKRWEELGGREMEAMTLLQTVRPTGERALGAWGGGHWARRGQVKEPPEGPGGQLQWIMPTIAPPQQGPEKAKFRGQPRS